MNKYPTLRVIILYAILGGFFGGLMVSSIYIVMIFFMFTHQDNMLLGVFSGLFFWLIAGMMGIVFGFLPALITGIVVAYYQFYKGSQGIYLRLFGIGFVATCLEYAIYSMISGIDEDTIKLSFGLSVLGGLSSIITGHFILPKIKVVQ